ncbi:ribosomal protection-like ABC-F family protein [Pediococcus argentinicus]|nr:ABC-F type ribosomal protection protein [Pediococcus argentinicus]NKZ21673.1 ABC-F type ribosomal protection protein [Pediococcus argentinicus]GEP18835.1 Lsa family ABC-F type ribosomal protection protein [Pediococcus argentinicus]
MGIIRIKNLSFSYDGQIDPLFSEVNLELDSNWKLGLIGRNGRGKTTLLRILQNQLKFNGTVETNLKFNYFPLPVKDGTQTVEQVLMEQTGRDYSNFWEVERELSLIGLPDDIIFKIYEELSPGQQTKALLAAMFADRESFQLIDEPTNHLDYDGRQILAQYLKQKQGFIVISHDRRFLNDVIDHVLSIDRAEISVFQGNYDTWANEREATDQRERSEKANLQKDIKKLEQASRQKQEWSRATEREILGHGVPDRGFISHKSAKVMSKALNIRNRADKKVEEKKSLLKNIEIQEPLTLQYEPSRSVKPLVEVKDLILKRDGRTLNHSISFELKAGDRIVVEGPNGVGKSTFIKALLNQDMKLIESGSANIRKNVTVSYLPQDFDQLSGSLGKFAEEKQVDLQELLAALRKLGFERSLFDHNIEDMSMGQKRKVALARSLCERAELYIWDEPLNYLDVITREQIQELILKYQPTMLFIDHDQEFVDQVQTKVVNLKKL